MGLISEPPPRGALPDPVPATASSPVPEPLPEAPDSFHAISQSPGRKSGDAIGAFQRLERPANFFPLFASLDQERRHAFEPFTLGYLILSDCRHSPFNGSTAFPPTQGWLAIIGSSVGRLSKILPHALLLLPMHHMPPWQSAPKYCVDNVDDTFKGLSQAKIVLQTLRIQLITATKKHWQQRTDAVAALWFYPCLIGIVYPVFFQHAPLACPTGETAI